MNNALTYKIMAMSISDRALDTETELWHFWEWFQDILQCVSITVYHKML